MARKCKYCKAVELPPAAKCTDIIEKKGYCSAKCLADHTKDKRISAQKKKEAKAHREAKERVKRSCDLKREAQTAFNAFIRARDMDKECISCDQTIDEVELDQMWKTGGAWDCGHYLTVGAHEELRFEELNAHRQCKSCNAGSGKYTKKGHTVAQRYREKLIERIGLDKVEWLEGPHEPKRYRAEDYRAIRDKYKEKKKQLLKAR